MICNGNGNCLIQTNCLNDDKKNTDTICNYNCEPIKCYNYNICNTIAQKWYFGCHSGVCGDCNMLSYSLFNSNEYSNNNKLLFKNNIECPICYETINGVKMLKCNHYTCYNCFKEIYHGYNEEPQKPLFPYNDEILEEYNNDENENPKWKIDFPLIEKWENECEKIEDKFSIKAEKQRKLLSKCPLCKK